MLLYNMDLNIEPATFPKIATRIRINVSVVLNEKAIVSVCFFEKDSEFKVLDTKILFIEGNEYKAWGNDDNYLKQMIFSKLGLKIIENEIITG